MDSEHNMQYNINMYNIKIIENRFKDNKNKRK